ncbi:MAG: hypothetical protein CMH57_06300 [Myxococcales bacterium]|nr:hypothetical protein [Myxococcales bacterium]
MNALKATLSAILVVGLLTSGCKSELDDKPAATVEDGKAEGADKAKEAPEAKKDEAKKEPAAGEEKKAEMAADKGMTYAIDESQSSIGWLGAKVTGDHKGVFKDFKGTVTVADGKITGLTYTVDTASMHTDDSEKLLGHLKSPDFLDVEKFPTASFTAEAFTPVTQDGFTHKVTGTMEMRGVKKKVTFPVKITMGDDAVTGETEFKINRKDFGIVYPGKPDDLIRDDVLLTIKMVAPKKG